MKIELTELQFPIFTKDYLFQNDFAKLSLIQEIVKILPDYSEANVNLLPLPQEAPKEILRIVWPNSAADKRIDVSLDKVLLCFFNKQGKEYGDFLHNSIEEVKKVFGVFSKFKINRLGLVSQFNISDYSVVAPIFIKNLIINPDSLSNPKELNLFYNTESDLGDGTRMNNIITINSSLVDEVIRMQTDINTLHDYRIEDRVFTLEYFLSILDYTKNQNMRLISKFESGDLKGMNF